MRRSDREITDFDEILQVMEKCDVCRLGLNGEDGYPYIVPLNFGLEREGEKVTLYFHGAGTGLKYDLMKRDDRCFFEMDCDHVLVGDEEEGMCTMAYESVMGRGRVSLLPDGEKMRALDLLCRHYYPSGFRFDTGAVPVTNVFRVEIESLTAKRRKNKKKIN